MRKILLGLVFFGVLLLVGFAALGYWLLQPISKISETQSFVVPKGQAVSIIATRLTDQKLIKHPLVFRAVVWKQQLTKKIQAGTFKLSSSQTPVEIALTLTEGTNDQWVTITEGLRREEIAEVLKTQVEGFDVDGFLAASHGFEGQLFPDTYLIPRQITAEAMVTLLTDTYRQKVIVPNQELLKTQPRTELEILVLASLIEREARGSVQQKIVGDILNHRLEIGMALQVDATLQYVRGFDGKSWWPTPLAADRALQSPFNTYANPGLPPRPICNPGEQAFLAALSPQSTDYLFYLHDNDGKIHPAETLEQHNANIAKYLQ